MSSLTVRKIIAPLLPYLTVGIGILVFHNAWVAILSYHAGMVGVAAWSKTGSSLKQAYGNNNIRVILPGVLAGVSGSTLLYFLWPSLSIPADINFHLVDLGLNQHTWPLFLAYFIIVNAAVEEYYWRGYLGSGSKSLTLNDLLFSGYHLIVIAGYVAWGWLIAVFFSLAVTAWFWRQIDRMNGGLLASSLSHLAADIIVILTIYFLSSG